MSKPPHLFTFLAQDEWKLAFTLAFLATSDKYYDAYPLDRYATPGDEGETKDWLELFKRAIRYLALEQSFHFVALDVHRDGRIIGETPICEPNSRYVVMLSGAMLTSLPDLPMAFRTAIELAEIKAPGLDLEPIREALDQVEHDISLMLHEADPDVVRGLAELRESALREVGYMAPRKLTVH